MVKGKIKKLVLIISALSSLAGCGGGDSSGGEPPAQEQFVMTLNETPRKGYANIEYRCFDGSDYTCDLPVDHDVEISRIMAQSFGTWGETVFYDINGLSVYSNQQELVGLDMWRYTSKDFMNEQAEQFKYVKSLVYKEGGELTVSIGVVENDLDELATQCSGEVSQSLLNCDNGKVIDDHAFIDWLSSVDSGMNGDNETIRQNIAGRIYQHVSALSSEPIKIEPIDVVVEPITGEPIPDYCEEAGINCDVELVPIEVIIDPIEDTPGVDPLPSEDFGVAPIEVIVEPIVPPVGVEPIKETWFLDHIDNESNSTYAVVRCRDEFSNEACTQKLDFKTEIHQIGVGADHDGEGYWVSYYGMPEDIDGSERTNSVASYHWLKRAWNWEEYSFSVHDYIFEYSNGKYKNVSLEVDYFTDSGEVIVKANHWGWGEYVEIMPECRGDIATNIECDKGGKLSDQQMEMLRAIVGNEQRLVAQVDFATRWWDTLANPYDCSEEECDIFVAPLEE